MKKKSKLGTLFAFLLKSTKIVKGLKILKSLKFVKPLITLGTMFLSLLVYGWVYGWVFAVGIIAMIFIHEMGHVIALKIKGYPTSAPVFIPMLGAFIFAPKNMDREGEAFVGIGGPILGTIGALLAWLVWKLDPEHSMLWLIMSYIGIVINLFNMLPIRPLDGGRVTQAVGDWFSWIGISLLLLLTIAMKDPGLLLIWILVLDDFDKVSIRKRAVIGSIVWVVMTVLILSGFGIENNTLGYIFDIFLGFLFSLILIIPAIKPSEERLEYEKEIRAKSGSDRPTLALKDKIKWLTVFLTTCTVLALCLWKQAESIQPWIEEQKRKEEQTHPPKTIGENQSLKGLVFSFFNTLPLHCMTNEEVTVFDEDDTLNPLLDSFEQPEQGAFDTLSIFLFVFDLLLEPFVPCNTDNTTETILSDRPSKSILFSSKLKVADWHPLQNS